MYAWHAVQGRESKNEQAVSIDAHAALLVLAQRARKNKAFAHARLVCTCTLTQSVHLTCLTCQDYPSVELSPVRRGAARRRVPSSCSAALSSSLTRDSRPSFGLSCAMCMDVFLIPCVWICTVFVAELCQCFHVYGLRSAFHETCVLEIYFRYRDLQVYYLK